METPDQTRARLRQLAETVASVPGVQAASITDASLPLGDNSELHFWLEGKPKPATQGEEDLALWYEVGSGYLKVLRLPLLRGRFFTERDYAHSPAVAVIDESFPRKCFPNQNPIGKHTNLDNLIQQVEVARLPSAGTSANTASASLCFPFQAKCAHLGCLISRVQSIFRGCDDLSRSGGRRPCAQEIERCGQLKVSITELARCQNRSPP